RRSIAGSPEPFYAEVMRRGTMNAGLYVPEGEDRQGPHEQDEIYVVWRGSGVFERDGERRPFSAGDMIFVPAGMTHRFVAFSPDLAVWVVFWGPAGGEAA